MAIQPNFLEQYIPGITSNTATASGNIGTQLSGLPSTSNARRKAAYFGATSGMPNSGVSNALGYDLYGQEAEAQKQQGFDNLLKMLTSYSGTAAPTTGQVLQDQQITTERNDRERDRAFARDSAQRQLDEAAAEKNAKKRFFKEATNYRGGATGGGLANYSRAWWM